VFSIELTATLAPCKANEGALHDVADVDIQMLDSQALGPIFMVPELDMDPNIPLNEEILAPVVGKLEPLISAITGELNERAFVRPVPTFLPAVTTITCDELDTDT
jgi:hypothetical protein